MSIARQVSPELPALRNSRASLPARRKVVTPMLSRRWRRSPPIQARFHQTCLPGRLCTRCSSSCGVRSPRKRCPGALTRGRRTRPSEISRRSPRCRARRSCCEPSKAFRWTKSPQYSTGRPRLYASLVTQAGREIAQQVATDILIIEDEPIIALDIETMVQELGHRVTGIARTHKEAIASARVQEPGLVLADIHLADGSSGLDAVNEILTSLNVPVIFITAYPERLLTGEKPEPAFLITKPFQADTVRATISQALFFDRRAGRPTLTVGAGAR